MEVVEKEEEWVGRGREVLLVAGGEGKNLRKA